MQCVTQAGVIYWFRNDLRLHDNPALQHAISLSKQRSTWLLSVYVNDTALGMTSPWGFVRTSEHRLAWTAMAVKDVAEQLLTFGSQLLQLKGEPSDVLPELMKRLTLQHVAGMGYRIKSIRPSAWRFGSASVWTCSRRKVALVMPSVLHQYAKDPISLLG